VIGTGLGLYIAKKMTEAQGGDIKIVSEGVGKGSTFTIELPVK
jgi:signal transduction histidine kinase